MNRNRLLRPLSALVLALAAAGPAAAQYPGNPYYPGINYNFGPGATLAGGAQVMQATGDLYIQQEQARQQREKYYQDKLQTRKMALDEANYERANTPTYTENQQRIQRLQAQRMMSQPAPAEIIRGDTLNMLMGYIQSMGDKGVLGPPLSINPALLQAINVKVGTAGAAPGAGMLKDGGKLTWPLMLRGPRQQAIDKLLPKAISGAAAGTLEPAQYTKIVSEVQSMKDDVQKQYRAEKINGSTYLSSNAFLDSLLTSLQVLQRPDAAMFFNGAYTVRGNNVPELIDNMRGQGLTFAPATPGSEPPYFSLHNSFVSYARTAQNSTGFQIQSLR